MSKFTLQRFVFPTVEEQDCRDLFVRKIDAEFDAFDKTMCKLEELRFDTWMNLFAARKWNHYCEIGKVFLGIKAKGNYIAEIVGTKLNAAFLTINDVLLEKEYKDQSGENCIFIELPDVKEYDSLYLKLFYQKNEPCIIEQIGWYTNAEPRRKTDMAIVTCTYKREQFISKTITLFRRYIELNQELSERLHLFVVDNGQTISLDNGDENIDIIPNINAGGAGGFGRGMIEVCKSERNFSRCLLMDDDVKILPESFGRTLCFADYLKEEYQDATINGAMLDFYAPNMFYENIGVQDGMWVRPVHCEGSLVDYLHVLKVNSFNDYQFRQPCPKHHAGWYYSSFPIGKESINNLPMPIFIRGDDVEFGWRSNGKAFIQLNGICIWHANFYYRVNKVTDVYYLHRNMIINNMIYTEGFENYYKKLVIEKYKYLNATYDYKSVELLIRALNDVLEEGKFFEIKPEELHKELGEIATEDIIYEDDWYVLEGVRNRGYFYGKTERKVNFIAKGVFKVFPSVKKIAKKNSEKSVGEWCPPTEAFLFRKHIKVYNLLKHSYYYRHYDYAREKALRLEFNKVLYELDNNFSRIRDYYKKKHKELITYDFWKKYLRLE